jgi:hypothetical protein
MIGEARWSAPKASNPEPSCDVHSVSVIVEASGERRETDMLRRRPLRRAAVVGGVAAAAHHAGKTSAQAQAAEQEQNEQIAGLQAQQAQAQTAPPPPAAPAAPEVGSADMVAQLENLKKLLDEGILTQPEFDMQKQKLLAGS